MSLDFQFETPCSFWLQKSAPEGQRRRIGGLISSESIDRENEIVLQRGLDLNPFAQGGWFNANHGRDPTDIVGFPDAQSIKMFEKGAKLPNGQLCPARGTWAEGWMLEGSKKADELWDIGQALAKAGGDRRLGFSIEGSVQRRTGRDLKTIAKAVVKNTAITHCPVGTDTRLDVLAKSLSAIEANDEELLRALTMGTPATPGTAPVGPVTGEGAGQILVGESLETGRKKKKKKKLTKSEAIMLVLERFPNATCETAGRIVDITLARLAHQTT